MSAPELPEHTRKFIEGLDKEDIDSLTTILAIWRKAQGWCAINRWLFRWVVFGLIAALIIASQFVDAVKNLFSVIRH